MTRTQVLHASLKTCVDAVEFIAREWVRQRRPCSEGMIPVLNKIRDPQSLSAEDMDRFVVTSEIYVDNVVLFLLAGILEKDEIQKAEYFNNMLIYFTRSCLVLGIPIKQLGDHVELGPFLTMYLGSIQNTSANIEMS